MYIYHYSEQRFDILKSRAAQKGPVNIQTSAVSSKELRSYENHISFFVEPIPYDILPALHHNEHPFYKEGKEVYQYKIPTSNLRDFYFELVESPEKTELRYDDSITDDEYYKRIREIYAEKGYVGNSLRDLENCVRMFQGKTREYFKRVPKLRDYEENKAKYAPTVPHLMVYPKHGTVAFSEVKKVIMGKRGELAVEHFAMIKKKSLVMGF